MTTRVLVADDHKLFNAGIRALLEGSDDIEVVAEARNGVEAVQLTRVHRPDVVLMDIDMPQLSGLDAIVQIRQEHTEVRIIVLTMHAAADYIDQALLVGAEGYLMKDAAAEELTSAIYAVMRGEFYLSTGGSRGVRSPPKPKMTSLEATRAALELSAHQAELLRRLVEGYTLDEIAFALRCDVASAQQQREELMALLEAQDLGDLMRVAIKAGLVKLDS